MAEGSDPTPPQTASDQPAQATGAAAAAPARNALSEGEINFINSLLDRIQRSYANFKWELLAYNICCMAALIFVIYSAARTAILDPQAIGTYVTSGGLFAVTGWRITQFLRGDIKTINTIIDRVLGTR